MGKKEILSFDKKLFEKVFIYNCLVDSVYLETVIEHTKPSFFTDQKIKSVFSLLQSYFLKYKKVPNLTELKIHIDDEDLRDDLKDVILSFKTLDKKYDKDVLITITEKFLKEKTVFQIVQKTSIDIQSGNFDTSKILKDFENACNISLIQNYGFDYLENIDKHCEDLLKTFETISTGWKWLDDKLGGGFMKHGKSLYMFFGTTNVGKSIFLGNIATNVLDQDKTVVLISMEMSEEIYSKRISAGLSNISMSNLKDNLEDLKSNLYTYKNQHKNAKLIIKEFPPKSVTPIHIKNYIYRLIRKGVKPDIIILDYLSLISPSTKGMNSYESQKEVAEQIRSLTYEFECSIVTAVQTNRSGYGDDMPNLETTSESMGIAHTVDAQIAIWTKEEDKDMNIIHMGIVKNRFGPRECYSILEIDYPTLKLKEPDDVINDFYDSPQNNQNQNSSTVDHNLKVKSTFDFIQTLNSEDDG
jgi:replicative DNA helicase